MHMCIGILSSTKADVTTELAKCYLLFLPFSDPVLVSEDEKHVCTLLKKELPIDRNDRID